VWWLPGVIVSRDYIDVEDCKEGEREREREMKWIFLNGDDDGGGKCSRGWIGLVLSGFIEKRESASIRVKILLISTPQHNLTVRHAPFLKISFDDFIHPIAFEQLPC
jgi:hypothetical protein